MVWDTTQSTLYTLRGAVERHNADFEVNAERGTTEGTAPGADITAIEPHDGNAGDNSVERRAAAEYDEAAFGQPSQAERQSPHDSPQEPSAQPIRAETERVDPCGSRAEAPREANRVPMTCEECPRRCPKCGKPLPERKPSPIEALLADRDTLLLAALILLLWHEKADIKLIGALAFILLSN